MKKENLYLSNSGFFIKKEILLLNVQHLICTKKQACREKIANNYYYKGFATPRQQLFIQFLGKSYRYCKLLTKQAADQKSKRRAYTKKSLDQEMTRYQSSQSVQQCSKHQDPKKKASQVQYLEELV